MVESRGERGGNRDWGFHLSTQKRTFAFTKFFSFSSFHRLAVIVTSNQCRALESLIVGQIHSYLIMSPPYLSQMEMQRNQVNWRQCDRFGKIIRWTNARLRKKGEDLSHIVSNASHGAWFFCVKRDISDITWCMFFLYQQRHH